MAWPLPKAVGEVAPRSGDFSKAIYFRMQMAAEVELRIGYRPGRLRDGWWLLFLEQMPSPDQFAFRGYSHMSGGIEQGDKPVDKRNPSPAPGLDPKAARTATAEDKLRAGGFLEKASHKKTTLKDDTISGFKLSGADRLAKVVPVRGEIGGGDEPEYPTGKGIPQWKLTAPLQWRAAAFIAPGQMYEGLYV